MNITKSQLKQLIKEELETILEQTLAPSDVEDLEFWASDPTSEYHEQAISALQTINPQQYGAPGTPNPKDTLGPPHNFSAGYERDFQLDLARQKAAQDAAAALDAAKILRDDEAAMEGGPSREQINWEEFRTSRRR